MEEGIAAAPQLRSPKPTPSPRISFPALPGGPRGSYPPDPLPGSFGLVMTSAPDLTPSLREFLDHPGPISLMLRGPPGPSRDRAAQELLDSFRGTRFLLSRTASQVEARSTVHSDVSVVEQSLPPTTLDQAARVRAAWARVVRGGLRDYGEADFLWLPGALQEVWSRLREDGQPSLVVLDGWDRWVEEYLGSAPQPTPGFPDRASLEADLVRRMARLPVHLVFVVEGNGSEGLEFLVNAVVSLGESPQGDRLVRWKSRSPRGPRPGPSSTSHHVANGTGPAHPGLASGPAFDDPR